MPAPDAGLAVTDHPSPAGTSAATAPADPGATPPAPADPTAVPSSRGGGTRGRRHSPLWRIRDGIDLPWRIGLSVAGVAGVLVAWAVTAAGSSPSVLPGPLDTVSAFGKLWDDGVLTTDLWASGRRILIGYGISVLVGVVLGLAIGTFAAVESFFEAQVAFLRYIPASAMTPVFLLWFGIGESPKIWLIVVGTVFFNVLMVADVARAVPRELLNASYTLGAGRLLVMRRVIFRHALPGMIDVARINLAAAWLMLVVAELLAAQEGLAYQIIRAQRFRAVDSMFALLIVFGVIGLLSDLFLRWLRNRTSPWAVS